VYKDPTLHKFVAEATLKELFFKTIAFFRITAQPSSALSVDLRILEGLDRELWRKGAGVDMMADFEASPGYSSSTSSSHHALHPPPPLPPPPPPQPLNQVPMAHPLQPTSTVMPALQPGQQQHLHHT
jgi:hypothetical protein